MSASPERDALLSALIDDGRASVEALARTTGLSAGHTRQLLAALAADHIEVRGIIHPSVFGQHAIAHLLITTAGAVVDMVAALVDDPAIPYVTRVAGDAAVAAEVRVADRAALAERLRRIRALPSVATVEVDEYLDVVKDAMVRLQPLGDVHLDAVDRVLLRELQADGRASYASLARAVDLTTASARARVLRLIDAGVVRIGVRQQARQDSLQIGFRVVADDDGALESALVARVGVEYLAASVGRSSFVGTIRVAGLAAAVAEIDALHALPGVRALTTWVHLAVVKEIYDTQDIPDSPTGRTR